MEEAEEKISFRKALGLFFKHFKSYSLKQVISAAYIPFALFYFEIFFRLISVREPFTWINWLSLTCAAGAFGLLLTLLCTITKKEKLNGWIAAIILQLMAAAYLLIHFVQVEFSIYIGPQSIAGGANGITRHAGDYIVDVVLKNWTTVLIFEAPVIIFLVLFLVFKLFTFKRFRGLGYIQILIVVVLFELGAGTPLTNMSPSWEQLTSEFDYDLDVRTFSALTATRLDVVYSIFSNPWKQSFTIDKKNLPEVDDPETYNMLEINFDELYDKSIDIEISKIHEYIESLQPTKKNKYTGLFKGKNLIQITAESYTPYILDEELTPTLWKLTHGGIVFDDYYQPLWSGSTTTGEFQILTGLLPSNGFYSMLRTKDDNMYMTIGNALMRENYTSLAFHNGTYDYFDRNLTHCNLGYSRFYANGNGMTGLSGKLAWPQSDIEMMQFSVPKIVNKEPFNAYFMTLSGHSKYDWKNFVVRKNIDEVREWAKEKGRDYTEAVLSYFAANLEFEKSMQYLIEELDKAGILDNTVIVMTGDHYPYSLSDDYDVDEDGHVKYYDVESNLINLFGFDPETEQDYSHNSLVIWTPSLDGKKSVHVKEPVCSVDILPTLLNLFGLPYDSRMLAGRDVFAENGQPLVVFLNYNWLTDRGYFNSDTREYTPKEGCSYDGAGDAQFSSDKEYVDYINTIVKNKMVFSQNAPLCDYYGIVFGGDNTEQTSDK